MSMTLPPVAMIPRKLPVLIVADVSASMLDDLGGGRQGRKIDALNRGIRELVAACAKQSTSKAEINIAAILFGNNRADLILPLTPAIDVQWEDVGADGNTPLGAALDLVVDYIEGPTLTKRDWRPVIALCSDGQPNDESWKVALARLNASSRGATADRFAIAIGAQADRGMLGAFVDQAVTSAESLGKVFEAGSEFEMTTFFKAVSWVSGQRSKSANPDKRPAAATRTGLATLR